MKRKRKTHVTISITVCDPLKGTRDTICEFKGKIHKDGSISEISRSWNNLKQK